MQRVSWARRSFVATLAALSLALGAGTAAMVGLPAGAATSSTPAPSAGSHWLKPPLRGLVDMGVQTPYVLDVPFPTVDTSQISADAGAFGGIVVNESWAQLEPAAGQERWNDLDASLAAVATWNAGHRSTPVGVKLRIFGGNTAPQWAKSLGGAPITLVSKGISRTFGRWWTRPYAQAWSSFQHALAARYDRNALVQAVSVSSCATLTGEPFIMGLSPVSIPTMEAAGWTPQAQERCLDGALADYSGWVHTPITFAFSPYRTVTGTVPRVDPTVTQGVMAACASSRAHGGPECVLGNNALSDSSATGPEGWIYSEIDTLWQQRRGDLGVYFQTVGAGVDCSAVALAIAHHAGTVELWPPNHYPGFSAIPVATLRQWNQDLRSGTPLSCS